MCNLFRLCDNNAACVKATNSCCCVTIYLERLSESTKLTFDSKILDVGQNELFLDLV